MKWFCLVLIFSTSFGLAASAGTGRGLDLGPSMRGSYIESDAFLSRIGFKKLSSGARETLQKEKNLHPVAELVLKQNADLFAGLESARELANLSYSLLVAGERLPLQQRNELYQVLIYLTVQQMSRFPLLGLDPVQTPEFLRARGAAAYNIRQTYLKDRANERYNVEKVNLIKSYTLAWQLADPATKPATDKLQSWLDEKLSNVLWDQYALSNLNQNRYLGRANLAVLVKYARERKNSWIENQLRNQLAVEGVFIDDILNATYRNPNSHDATYRMKSGDIALEFSNGQDAFFTSVGVEPSHPENMVLARKFGLISQMSYAALFISSDYYSKALEKLRSNLVLNETEEKMIADYWNPAISKGYSHSGIVEVQEDKQTGIALAWIWDIYPNRGVGGVRLMAPEGFSYPDRFIRIGFARYSAQKVLRSFKQQIATRGYLSKVHRSNQSIVAENTSSKQDEPFISENTEYWWPATTPKDTVLSWLKVSDEDAERWYQNEVLPRVFKRILDYAVSRDALAFAENLVNGQNMAYCSQLIQLSFLQAANFDVAPTSDQYRLIPAYLAKKFPEKLHVDTEGGFVSPAGLVWQAHVLESQVQFDFERTRINPVTRTKAFVDRYTHYLEANPQVAATALKIEPAQIGRYYLFTIDDLD